jgi:gas vesicle protein
MWNLEYFEKKRIYIFIAVGAIIGFAAGVLNAPTKESVIKYSNNATISVSDSNNQPVQPTSVGADQLGSAILWNQQGSTNGVQQNPTNLDQIIGNSSILIK